MTPARTQRIAEVLCRRQKNLAVIIENVIDPHNVGAILRSCDAFGIGEVHLLYTQDHPPRMQELKTKAAASAAKWLKIQKWHSAAELIKAIRKKKMKLAVTTLEGETAAPARTNLSGPFAIAIGNEHGGVSTALLEAADVRLKIPMRGFVQSFNVSVAAAIVLYEACRQRNG